MVEHIEQGVRAPAGPRAQRQSFRRTARAAWAWSLEHVLLFPIVALFLGTIVAALPRQLVSDSWFAIFGGHEVIRHGFPGTDHLTLWTQGHEWVDQQWLGQVALYGLYAAGGVKLALLGHAAAVGAAFLLAIVFARWRGASTRAICWLALPVIFILIWGSWVARAQSFAFAMFVGLVWLLIADARAPSRKVLWAVPLLVLWANVHGSALTGAILVVLAGVTYAFERRRQSRREWLPRAVLMSTVPIACLFVSPYALSLPRYYHDVLLNPGFRDFIVEWRPTTPNFQTSPFYLLAFLAVWLLGKRTERFSLFEQVLLGVTILMGLHTMRMVVWFALVALMVLPVALDGVIKPNTSAARFPLLNRSLICMSVVGTLAILTAVAARPGSWFERDYPRQALAVVRQADAAHPGVRVFANEQLSDWLLLKAPQLRGRIAFDIRFELVSRQQLVQLVNARRQVEGWRKPLAPYGLFVLKQGPDSLLAKGLLKEKGARRLYRGHGLVIVFRPSHRSGSK
jgi:hypothetical protein